jgi:hypothetical protein
LKVSSRDDDLFQDFIIGLLLNSDHWEALRYVLEKRLSGIEEVDYTLIAYLQDIFDQLNHYLNVSYYGAFDYEMQLADKKMLKLVFYKTYEEMENSTDDHEWMKHSMLIDLN